MGRRFSLAARWSAACGMMALLAVVIGPVTVHLGVLPPFRGFMIFSFGLVAGGVLSLILGGIGVWRTGASGGREGRGRAWIGLTVGSVLTAYLIWQLATVAGAPPIHDITTDMEDPPQFLHARNLAENQGRSLDYPDGGPEVPRLQREAYSDIDTIRVALAPDDAFQKAMEQAQSLGWTVTWSNADLLRFEALDTTPVFRFVDDVVVRVRADRQAGSLIDVRSLSRVGISDLGKNAQRIRSFATALQGR